MSGSSCGIRTGVDIFVVFTESRQRDSLLQETHLGHGLRAIYLTIILKRTPVSHKNFMHSITFYALLFSKLQVLNAVAEPSLKSSWLKKKKERKKKEKCKSGVFAWQKSLHKHPAFLCVYSSASTFLLSSGEAWAILSNHFSNMPSMHSSIHSVLRS